MKQKIFIQFTSGQDLDCGFNPELNRWYEVSDIEDTYEIEEYDNYNEEYITRDLEAITIILEKRQSWNKCRAVVTEDSNITYNLLTIDADDDSPLFV